SSGCKPRSAKRIARRCRRAPASLAAVGCLWRRRGSRSVLPNGARWYRPAQPGAPRGYSCSPPAWTQLTAADRFNDAVDLGGIERRSTTAVDQVYELGGEIDVDVARSRCPT